MTQYLLSVHGDPADPMPPAEEIEEIYAQVDSFNQKLKDIGAWVFAGGLEPSGARLVDATSGNPVTTDGPYPETKELLGGFWIIEADDDEKALKLAEEASAACVGPVEVRAFQSEPGD
jgi:hypothetical protein